MHTIVGRLCVLIELYFRRRIWGDYDFGSLYDVVERFAPFVA